MGSTIMEADPQPGERMIRGTSGDVNEWGRNQDDRVWYIEQDKFL